ALGAPKPAPDVYLAAAAACGVPSDRCVVIEDSAQGARAGLAAGARVLGFAPHGADGATARSLAALGVPLFGRMEELPSLLGLTSVGAP
ncbi:MAG TPA: HAD-IA family hydrolase, partial [Tabrizicola sp.]|nr:HAD-IA family hydrolase [Tabrizicola sp.]